MQKSVLSTIFLYGLQRCDGFVSISARTNIRPRSSRTNQIHPAPKEWVLMNSGIESNDRNEQQEFIFEYVDSETEYHVASDQFVVTGTSNAESHLPTDILRESITNLNPEGVFEDISAKTGSLMANDPTSGLMGDVKNEESIATPTPELPDWNRNEDVKAILEASGQAAAEAEASMPPELIEQFELTASNGTMSSAAGLEGDTVSDILTAASVVGEPATKTNIETPEVSKILKFAIPAIGVWLCGPLLSLIDTSAVGIFSGTVQQAALNPAVAITDYAALLIVSISMLAGT